MLEVGGSEEEAVKVVVVGGRGERDVRGVGVGAAASTAILVLHIAIGIQFQAGLGIDSQ